MTDKDKPISSVDVFFDKLGTISDPIQLIKILCTCERLQQLKFVREQLNLQPNQQQLVGQEHQELVIKLYRQLFGLSSSYELKDTTASEFINSFLQQLTPNELLDQFQNYLPSPNDLIARESSYRKRLAGIVTFTNLIWLMSISLFVLSVRSLFIAFDLFALMDEIVLWVPIVFWEFLAHTICFLIIYRAGNYEVGTSHRNYIALTGCLLWSLAWFWSFSRRESILPRHSGRLSPAKNFAAKVLILIYAIIAVQYQSHVIGTLTVQLILAYFGFNSENALVVCKFVAGVLLLIYSVPIYMLKIKISNINWLAPFETGVVFWCTFAYHTALLIDSVRYTGWNLLLEIFSLVFTLWYGTVYDIQQMKSIGGTSLVWWFFIQIGRIDWRNDRTASIIVLFFSIFLWKLCYVIQLYPDYFLF